MNAKIKEVKEMSDNDLCAKIAEACGILKPKCDRIGGCLKETGKRNGFDWSCKCDNEPFCLPKYTTDLNAMHEAEIMGEDLDMHWTEKWLEALTLVVSNGEETDYFNVGKFELLTMTARQRAEAFVVTMETK